MPAGTLTVCWHPILQQFALQDKAILDSSAMVIHKNPPASLPDRSCKDDITCIDVIVTFVLISFF
jgi:hypothetical protein